MNTETIPSEDVTFRNFVDETIKHDEYEYAYL